MIPQRPRDGQRPARRGKIQPEPVEPGYLSKQTEAARSERIAEKVAAIRASLPTWALLPPWDAEKFLEGDAKSQAELPFDGGPAE